LDQHHITHKINTTGKVVCSRPYRLPLNRVEETKKIIEDLLAKGIIIPSDSPYSSPLVLIPKKDGTIRPCVDYTRLNAITTDDQYPLPRIEDLIHAARGRWFSTLDLRAGYHQIPMDPQDAIKTAVTTPFGLFHFLRMPFGLKTAASTFQRYLDHVVRGLLGVVVYIDDILVFSDSKEEHLVRLKKLFDRLEEHGLRVHRQKCSFLQTEVNYLGYLITSEGYEPNPDRVKAIQSYPTPTNVQELRRFLGMANFYRLHVPHFSELATPLFSITDNFGWSEEADLAFKNIKGALASVTLLRAPIPGIPFHVYTDASNAAAGAAILQRDQPLAFYSSKFSETEKRYSTFDREALSIIKTFRAYKHWFSGAKVLLHTDHKPLLGLTTMKDPSPKQTRWIQLLAEFDITWQYEPGASNQVADCMSRVDQSADTTISAGITLESIGPPEWAAELADYDPHKHKEDIGSLQLTKQSGYWFDTSAKRPRLFMPPNLRHACFRLIHDTTHFGVRKTYHALATRFIWPHLRKDIQRWCSECQVCQAAKGSTTTGHPPLSFLVHERFHTIHVDIVGPLPISQRGNQYLLTIIDRFSRWIEAIPINNISAESVSRVVLDQWVCRYGVPKCLISDQGRQFESQLFTSLMLRLGVEKHRTTAYHPQSNGAVERAHRTLKQCIRTLTEAGKCWERALPLALFAMRSSVSEATQFPPSNLVFGGDIATSADFLIHSSPTSLPCNIFADELSTEVLKNLRIADANQPVRFPHAIKSVGPWVWVKQPPNQQKSFDPHFQGPFKVISQKGPVVTVSIQGRHSSINIDRIKQAIFRNSDEDLHSSNDRPQSPIPQYPNTPIPLAAPQVTVSKINPDINSSDSPHHSRYGRPIPYRFSKPQFVFRRSK
jgi:hypothetical protein